MPATQTQFQFVLDVYRDTAGARQAETDQLASFRITPDWQPAMECARLAAARQRVAAETSAAPITLQFGGEEEEIQPVWHATQGPPYVAAVRIGVAAGEYSSSCDLPTTYFEQAAQSAAARLVRSGQLADGDTYRYVVTAFAGEPTAPANATFSVQTVPQQLPLASASLQDLMARSEPAGGPDQPADDPDDLPVFIPRNIIDEITARLHAAGEAETGGILIGRLQQDPQRRELFVEVTAQVPARHAKEELTTLTFTPEDWADVDAAIRLRGQNEIHAGWWHTHPARAWCAKCPPENRAVCKVSGEFFSSQDLALHRTVFPRAYSLGLVVSDSYAHGLTYPLFGWRNGMVQERAYRIVNL